jgi:prepilin-type processing-associated H-X9-DG protein
LQPYVKSTQVFICPSQSKAPVNSVNGYKSTYAPNAAGGNPYGNTISTGFFALCTNGGSVSTPQTVFSPGTKLSLVPVPAVTISFSEYNTQDLLDPYASWSTNRLFAGHLGTTNYAFADGHVKAMRPEDTIVGENMWSRNEDTLAATSAGNQTQIKAFVAAANVTYQ